MKLGHYKLALRHISKLSIKEIEVLEKELPTIKSNALLMGYFEATNTKRLLEGINAFKKLCKGKGKTIKFNSWKPLDKSRHSAKL